MNTLDLCVPYRRHIARWLMAVLMLCLPLTASAIDLQEAKAQGLVGESITGYLGVVKEAPGVAALVNDINRKRKASYQEIAERNGTTLNAVEQLAAKKAIEKTPPGQLVQLSPGGAWVKK